MNKHDFVDYKRNQLRNEHRAIAAMNAIMTFIPESANVINLEKEDGAAFAALTISTHKPTDLLTYTHTFRPTARLRVCHPTSPATFPPKGMTKPDDANKDIAPYVLTAKTSQGQGVVMSMDWYTMITDYLTRIVVVLEGLRPMDYFGPVYQTVPNQLWWDYGSLISDIVNDIKN